MKKAIYIDTRFCHNSTNYSQDITLERIYKCSNCNAYIFEHHFKNGKVECPYCKEKLIIENKEENKK